MIQLQERPTHPDALARDFAWNAETVHVLALSADATVMRWNGAAARSAGAALRAGEPVETLLASHSASLLRAAMARAGTAPVPGLMLTFSDGERFAYTLRCRLGRAGDEFLLFGEPMVEREKQVAAELMDVVNELSRITREKAKLAAQLETALAELRESHWHVRRIQEFLPICAECHRVPAQAAQPDGWKPLVSFLADNGLLMSHGYCPECAERALAALDAAAPPAGA